jgi:hypothetical protein
MDLRAGETDNSSVDGHAVLDTFVVLHSPRTVKVMKNDKEIIARVHECDVWHHFGDTISKGKKNDHVFHNACLVAIVDYYRRTFKRDNKPTIELVSVTKALPTHDIAAATGELLNETTNLPLMKYYYGPTTVPVNTNAIKISGRLLLSLKYSLVFRLSTDLRRSITSRASGMERER